MLHNVKLDGGRIDYHPQPGSSEQPPEKLPLTFYKTEPRATIEVVQRRARGNDTGVPLECAPALACRQHPAARTGTIVHAIAARLSAGHEGLVHTTANLHWKMRLAVSPSRMPSSEAIRWMPLCRCESWVGRPAILFQISNHENFFHYLNDGFMAVLQTLTETHLLPDRLARRACSVPHGGPKMHSP